jgi:hypothetical protein
MFSGDELLFRVKASHPHTGRIFDLSTVTVKAYEPTKDPKNNSTHRADPDATATLAYDNNRLAYTGTMETDFWAVGNWTLLFEIAGEVEAHVYRTQTVQAG